MSYESYPIFNKTLVLWSVSFRKVGKLLRDNQEKLDPNEAGLAVGT